MNTLMFLGFVLLLVLALAATGFAEIALHAEGDENEICLYDTMDDYAGDWY